MKKALLVGIVLSLICAIVGCGQKEKAQYTLTFYSEGEVVHTLTAEEGLTIALREEADDPVKAEDEKNTYTFAGWTLGEEGELTESYTVTGDASFYATFTATPIVYYSVTFVDEWEGTRTVLSEQQVRAGKCAELPAQSPEHEGYTFTGWSPDPSAAVTQDTEYVAQYDVNTYKLTLSTPLGETEAQYDFGAELLLEEPELPDFLSFANWYADEDFTQPFALEKMPARDVQVYAKCEFDFGAAKLSVGENLVYGGNNTVSVEGLPADEKIVYTYLWKDGQNNGTAESYALHAGHHELSVTVKATFNEVEGEKTFTSTVDVAKAQGTIDVSGVEKNYTYTGAVQTINEGATTNNKEDGELTYSSNTFKTVEEGNALTVKVTLSEGENYTGAETTFKITVAKAQGTIDVGGVNKNYTYTGAVQTIDKGATTNNGEDGELTYSNNTFTTVAEGNALTVKVTLSEGANYTGAETTFQIHVDKAQGTINVDGVKKDYTYTGALQTIDKGATTNNNEGDGVLTYSSNTFTTVAEGNALTVKVTLSEGANYTGAETTFQIHVDKAQGTIDVNGVEKNYTYTGELQTIDKGATTNNKEDGELTYASNTFKTVAEGNALTVKVTLSEGANYTGAETTFQIHVDKAQGTIDVNGVEKNYTYTGELQTVEGGATTNNDEDGELSYSNNTFTTVEQGNALTVKVTLSEGENYTGAEATFQIHVDKAQGTIDVNGVEKHYTYTGALQTIDKGATTNNKEDGELTYSDNEFTTVAQGNALTVKVTLSEGENYTSAEATFQIHVDKAKGTINVDGVKKDYTYTGAVQTINEGATTNNNEGDGKLTYSDNTFTTVAEGNALTVKVTLSEGANYTGAEATFTITVAKAKGTIDVSGVKKDYTYTGAVQTVEGGATSNNQEDAQFTYSDNTFTTVAEGNALDVKVTLKEGANYTSAETTFKITVAKQTLERLPEEASPQIPVQINERGKTLESVTFPDGKFSWQDTGTELVIGEHGYAATYDPDPENINPLTVTITFTTRKQVLTVEVTGGEADYTKGAVVSSLTLATLALTDESGEECSAEVEEYVDFKTDGKSLTLDVGSTYSVPWTLTLTENDYYELQYGDTKQASFHDECTFKWKSVELESKLYTVEDALKLLESGKTATVKFNTSFASKEISEKLYADDSYHTVKEGATLLVPYGADDTGVVEQTKANTGRAAASSNGYVTLTLSAGELVVNGKLLVNAYRVSENNFSGMVYGAKYGSLSLAKDTKVTVKSGATFESMGFTYGEGEVFAESGSTVYEPFAMPGWKGGTVAMMCGFSGVFPLNQYTFSSFISKVHLQTGASYKLRMSVTASSKAYDSEVEFIGQEDTAFLQLTDGVLIKYLDESNGKVHFDVEGTISFHNLSLSVGGSSASTNGMQVPIPGNFTFTLKTGSVTVTNGVQLKLLPGASLTTEAGTQLIIEDGGKLLTYGDKNYTLSGVTQWQDGAVAAGYPNSYMTSSYRKAPNFGYNGASQAEVLIKGKFRAEGKATVCATFRGAEGATLELSESVVLTAQVKEDQNAGSFRFFTATFNCGDLTAGNYTYTGGKWVTA